MRVLVVDAYPAAHPYAAVVRQAIEMLEKQDNQVDYLSLVSDEFSTAMTADERAAY